MTAPAPTTFTVPVTGGDLLVHDLSGPDASADAPLVVLVHMDRHQQLPQRVTHIHLDHMPAPTTHTHSHTVAAGRPAPEFNGPPAWVNTCQHPYKRQPCYTKGVVVGGRPPPRR